MKEFWTKLTMFAEDTWWNVRTYWVMWLTGFVLSAIIVSCAMGAAELRENAEKDRAKYTPEEILARQFKRHLDDQFGVMCYVWDNPNTDKDEMDCVQIGAVATYRPVKDANGVSK